MTNPKVREYILGRFRLESARNRGGLSTAQIYGGSGTPFALRLIDDELTAMRKDGLLGFAKDLWFLRGGGVVGGRLAAPATPEGAYRPSRGPAAREAFR